MIFKFCFFNFEVVSSNDLHLFFSLIFGADAKEVKYIFPIFRQNIIIRPCDLFAKQSLRDGQKSDSTLASKNIGACRVMEKQREECIRILDDHAKAEQKLGMT